MEEDFIKPEIASAFNAGYILQQYEPELINKIVQNNNSKNEYFYALTAGMEKYSEIKKDFKPDWMKSDRLSKSLEDRDNNLEKDKDLDRDI